MSLWTTAEYENLQAEVTKAFGTDVPPASDEGWADVAKAVGTHRSHAAYCRAVTRKPTSLVSAARASQSQSRDESGPQEGTDSRGEGELCDLLCL